MKKLLAILGIGLLLTSCSPSSSTNNNEVKTLKIYNWEDYINIGDEETGEISVLDQFVTYYQENFGETIKIQYNTFETNETMLNQLKSGKDQYDLICPSDYIIQKMIREDLIIPFEKPENYVTYGSKYLQKIFDESKATTIDGRQVSWSEYAIPYMWGTMGLMYDSDAFNEELGNLDDINTWGVIWNSDYYLQGTLKDSLRDTYCAAVIYAFRDQLATFEEENPNDTEGYNRLLTEIMNDVRPETLEIVEDYLNRAKANVYGFEVDSGKTDIVRGLYDINFCWSGDAVFAMDTAEEENNKIINYTVPKEGSNVWFDGWVMPKGAQVELAREFLNFLSDPSIAAQNMDYIGYTSAIAGDDIFDLVNDWYGVSSLEDYTEEEIDEIKIEIDEEYMDLYNEDPNFNALSLDEKYQSIMLKEYSIYESEELIQTLITNEELFEVDLTYFFDGTLSEGVKSSVITEELGRQFSAQYPTMDVIERCAVMQDFGEQNNEVTAMWIRVKGNDVPIGITIFLIVFVVCVLAIFIFSYISKKIRKDRVKAKRLASQSIKNNGKGA